MRFIWNNGGGAGVVWKALNEDVNSPSPKGPKWYKIVVERVSYTARLWVLPGGFPVGNIPPATNSSDPNFGRLDIGPNDRVWIGGLPPGHERPPEILTLQQGLVGCLHSIMLNERPLGLWNFVTDTPDSCSACERGYLLFKLLTVSFLSFTSVLSLVTGRTKSSTTLHITSTERATLC